MTAVEPTIGPCERCRLTRPVWPYIPSHHGHLYDPATSECRWCGATEQGRPQPLLCVGCTQREAAEENAASSPHQLRRAS